MKKESNIGCMFGMDFVCHFGIFGVCLIFLIDVFYILSPHFLSFVNCFFFFFGGGGGGGVSKSRNITNT